MRALSSSIRIPGYTVEAGVCVDGGTVLFAGTCTDAYQNANHVAVKSLLVPGMVT